MSNIPGVMIYYDIMPALEWLSIEDKGALFAAILSYGHGGVIPDFTGTLGAIWALIAPRIDRDAEAYRTKVRKAEYAAFCRDCKRNGIPKMSLDDWLAANP